MAGILNTGLSGLLSFQRSLETTSHNITNANTPGYSRQRVELATRIPQETGEGFLGKGVFVQDIARFSDRLINMQLQQGASEFARLNLFVDLTGEIDNIFADNVGSLSPSMQAFFDSVQDLANDPGSFSARQVLLSESESLIERFHSLDRRLTEQNLLVNSRISEAVDEINTLALNIASVNGQIVAAGAGTAQRALPNDLLDTRERLIQELSQFTKVSTIENSNGSINVFIGNGQGLVFDTRAQTLTTIPDVSNPTRTNVGIQTTTGVLDISSQLSGGEIGALMDFRREVLSPSYNELGRIALVLSDTFNAQHRQGMDLNNTLGGDFFTVPVSSVIANSGNTGTATVTAAVANSSAVTTSDYRLSFDGANFTLTRLSDNTSVTGARPFAIDGLNISISAGAASGDSFLIQPTRNAARDIALTINNTNNIAAAFPVRTSASNANLGDATIDLVRILDSTDADLLDQVNIVFNDPPTDFDIVNITDGVTIAAGVPYASGGNIDFNGVRVRITGTVVAGDVFTSQYNIGGVSDNRNALALASLQTQNLVGGTASYQNAYTAIVGRIGSVARQADINQGAQASLLEQLQQRRDAVSGVNLDEEAANLVRFQQAYEAAAQVIAVSDTLFQTLLGAVRR